MPNAALSKLFKTTWVRNQTPGLVCIGVTVSKSGDYWPLDFDVSEYAIADSKLVYLGHPFTLKGAIA